MPNIDLAHCSVQHVSHIVAAEPMHRVALTTFITLKCM